MNEIKTLCGLQPTKQNPIYTIRTDDVRKFIQNRINGAVGNNSVRIDVYSVAAGKYFVPFVLCLPMSAVKSKKKGKDSELSIFDGKNRSKGILNNNINKIVSSYVFDVEDMKRFFTQDWRREFGVSLDMTKTINAMREPHVYKIGEKCVVEVILDPARVFFNMLAEPNKNKEDQDRIFIDSFTKLDTYKYVYEVLKTPKQEPIEDSNVGKLLLKDLQRKFK